MSENQARVIAVANQKGGVGKTTSSVSIAAGLTERGKRVLGVDADPQNTFLQWSAASDGDEVGLPFPVVALDKAGPKIHREIQKHMGNYDYIVVDCPPSVVDPRNAVVMMVADVLVMPTSSSPADFWSSVEFVKMVRQALITNPSLKPRWLLNKHDGNKLLDKEIDAAIKETNIERLEIVVPTRECYRQACALGVTALQLSGRGPKAARVEILKLADIIMEVAELETVEEEE